MDIFLAGTEQLSPDLVPTKRMWKIFTKRLLLVFSGEILGIPCCCKFVALFPDACTRLSSILQRMMTFANPPNSPRFKPYHSKQKADNEVWNWIKFQFLHFPFSFVNRTQCCAMIAMQTRSRMARSILWCKCIDILKKIHCMMQTQIKYQKYFHSKGIKHREKGNIGFWASYKNLSTSSHSENPLFGHPPDSKKYRCGGWKHLFFSSVSHKIPNEIKGNTMLAVQ